MILVSVHSAVVLAVHAFSSSAVLSWNTTKVALERRLLGPKSGASCLLNQSRAIKGNARGVFLVAACAEAEISANTSSCSRTTTVRLRQDGSPSHRRTDAAALGLAPSEFPSGI